MATFKFIHVADLHLDVSIKGVVNKNVLYNQYTFDALDNLVRLAKEHKPDCILFAGDVWNHEDASLKARIALRNACVAFDKMGIKVFIAHGNHDPLNHNFQKMTLPENVTLFGEEVSTEVFEKNGKPIAALHGISHATPKETRNLASFFPQITKEMKEELFHISILHTSLNKPDGTQIYAPCTVGDLKGKNPHYWALGHIHEFQILNEEPYIVYPGAIQGIHINEQNDHGVAIVTMDRLEDNSVSVEINFENTAPLIWKEIEFQVPENAEDMPALTNALYDTIFALSGTLPSNCRHCIVRITLKGHTNLDKNLRNNEECEELRSLLNEYFNQSKPLFSVKDIQVQTKPQKEEKDWDEMGKGNDFLALVLQQAVNWEKDNTFEHINTVYQECLIPKQYRKRLPLPNDPELIKEIVEEAKQISMQVLEQ